MSTVSKTDVYAVLMALVELVPQQLSQGKIVQLGKLGSFSVGVNSTPAETAEKLSSANVKRIKLNFRPAKELKKEVENFAVQKVS